MVYWGVGGGFWPFGIAFGALAVILFIIFVVFWIWAIIDCAKRKFRSDIEKIVWILIIIFVWVFAFPLGGLIYLFVIRYTNPHGLVDPRKIR